MNRFMFSAPSLLPFLDAEGGGAGGGETSPGNANPGGQQGNGDETKPFATFPTSAEFAARMDREANTRLTALATELGFESVDAMKAATKAAKERADAEKTELEREKEARTKAESDSQTAIAAANTRLIKAEAKVQAAALGIKPERIEHALKLADLSQITVNDAGDADSTAIKAALETIVTEMPELKGSTGNVGGTGSNPPGGGNTASEIADLEKQLEEARKKGDRTARISIMSRLDQLRRGK